MSLLPASQPQLPQCTRFHRVFFIVVDICHERWKYDLKTGAHIKDLITCNKPFFALYKVHSKQTSKIKQLSKVKT